MYYYCGQRHDGAAHRRGRVHRVRARHGNIYGTSKAAVGRVAETGRVCVLDIDVQGAQLVTADPPLDAVYCFILPPSMPELERRLRGRGTETEEKIRVRLGAATREIELGRSEKFWDAQIVNADKAAAYGELKALVQKKCLPKPWWKFW